MRFLFVSHSANALLARRGLFNLAESLEWTPPEKGARWMYGSYMLVCVSFGTYAFLVLYLFSSHPLMSSGSDSRLDYYLTRNGSTGGVPDSDRMFSRQLLTRNAWKLTNNRCKTVVHRPKLMTYIFWGIIKRGFPVRYKNVLKMFCQLLIRCTFVLPDTYQLLVWWCRLIVLYMFGNRVVIVRFMLSIHRSREPRAAAGMTFITG